MFAALRARLAELQRAPQRARELAADRITATMPKGRAAATDTGITVFSQNAKPYVGPRWTAIIQGAIADAVKGG